MINVFLLRKQVHCDYDIAGFLDGLRRAWLDDNGIGFNQHVPTGYNHFGLRGDELDLFLRLCILRILQEGGRPVRFVESAGDWEFHDGYGDDPDRIADAMIGEWKKAGAPIQPEWNSWLFARPDRMP